MAKLFNDTLDQLISDSSSHIKSKVRIGNHNLDCSGGVMLARYKNIPMNKFDGIHMYGPSGMKAYTASVLNILSEAKLVLSSTPRYYDQYDYQSCQIPE